MEVCSGTSTFPGVCRTRQDPGSRGLAVLSAASVASCGRSGILLQTAMFKKQCPSVCCSLTFRNTKINIPYPILAILLFWSIASDTQCILMHGFMITSKPYSLLLQFYRSNLVGYSTEIILNREILLDLNLKLLNCYLLLPLLIRILGTRTA